MRQRAPPVRSGDGPIALVGLGPASQHALDSTSRIGQTGRVYYSTLLDENAAAHIAFGMGFGGARTTKPARNLNRSPVHLDVMIGSPDFEVTGVTAKGRRIALIHDGLWQI